ncbi:SCO6745 family protein [Actinomadura gamaensis]|uniref:SalK n=1 Tax=Actinomadura gamaensis TaxID=1763541 RepID=A0ABV9TS82_9ACTN
MDESLPRRLWTLFEPVHAITYFAPECSEANKRIGLRGYWMGYFGSRAAPMGAVPAGVVTATFHGFHPSRVERAIPDAWTFASPEQIITARAGAAAAALRRIYPQADETAALANPLIERVVREADPSGRPLFAANRALPWPDDPVAALWQGTTSLREERGDGHVGILTAEGLDGCEANILAGATSENSPSDWLKEARAWPDAEWTAAQDRLKARGLLDPRGTATAEAHSLKAHIESRTDALAARPLRALTDPDHLAKALEPLALAVAASGDLPFPNPMGVPRPAAS